jgi:O-antigen/teichoic acid export membrane protein
MKNLKQKTVDALIWRGMEIFGQQGMRVVIQIVLARLLLPEQFGLIGMLTIFIMLAEVFINSGFGQALIQKKNADHADECSIFYFNIIVSVIATGILWLLAPWIAVFYKQPLLIPLTRVLSLNLIINAFAQIQITILTKKIDFKSQLKVGVSASLFSGVVGVLMAYKDFGVWALVGQQVSRSLLQTMIYWFVSDWRPALILSFSSLRSLFNFGSKLLFSGLLGAVFNNIYLVVIGKLFSLADLGFYSKAKNLQQFPVRSTSSIVSSVTFPVFAIIQDERNRVKVGVRKSLTTLVMIITPCMLGLAIVARPLVSVILTDKWLPCVPFLQLLCIEGILWPLHVINLDLLKALGRSDLFFRLEVIKKILTVISIAVTYRWGILAMIYGQIIMSILAYYLNSYYSGKLINYSIKEQMFDLAPYFGLAIVMGISVYSIKWFPFPNNLALLATQVLVGFSVYTAMGCVFKMPAFIEIIDISRSKLKFRKLWQFKK